MLMRYARFLLRVVMACLVGMHHLLAGHFPLVAGIVFGLLEFVRGRYFDFASSQGYEPPGASGTPSVKMDPHVIALEKYSNGALHILPYRGGWKKPITAPELHKRARCSLTCVSPEDIRENEPQALAQAGELNRQYLEGVAAIETTIESLVILDINERRTEVKIPPLRASTTECYYYCLGMGDYPYAE
jgi:hypothetical protein